MNYPVLRYVAAAALTLFMATPAWAQPTFIPCDTAVDCNDDNACTTDTCFIADGMCGDPNESGALTASDALHILRFGTGLSSSCRPAVCDVDSNGVVCATDALRVMAGAIGLQSNILCPGECMSDAVMCDDGDVCNGAETCDPQSGCMEGEALQCDDQNVCNGEETCDATSGCVEAAPRDCDDGNACTDDLCDDSDGCSNEPIVCDDGNTCNGTETCDPSAGCVEGEALVCDDGDVCNGVEDCDAELGCIDGDAAPCEDLDDCTVDSCDPVEGCSHSAVECDDGNACTMDSCSAEGGCLNEPISCDDGDVCNGMESCDPESGCVEGEPLVCNDGDVCNGDESCDAAAGCMAGAALVCDDEDNCTVDSCDALEGCAHAAMDCNDGDACTVDSCSQDQGCTYGPVACSDNDVCNGEETCDAELGCLAGEALVCDDGQFCNGEERCDAELGCSAGEAPACSDDDECTQDRCDEEVDACAYDGMAAGSVDVISFEGHAEGTILSEVYCDGGMGPVGVYGDNIERLPGDNAAVIYDSACSSGSCSGGDDDLGTPNETFDGPGIGVGGEAGAEFENSVAQGNILIVAHNLIDVAPADGLVDNPSDQGNARPVATHLDFTAIGPVVVKSLRLLDVETTEDPAVVELYGAEGELLSSVALPQVGNNGVTVVEFDRVEGVWSMIVSLFGSGAIDDIVIEMGTCETSSTSTTTSTSTSTTIVEPPTTSTTMLYEEQI